jgi:hypothetical protein
MSVDEAETILGKPSRENLAGVLPTRYWEGPGGTIWVFFSKPEYGERSVDGYYWPKDGTGPTALADGERAFLDRVRRLVPW